jgi:hypothetical protein
MTKLNRKAGVGAACALLLGLLAQAPGHAEESTWQTELTFSRPFSLPGVTLVAGTYIFERVAPLSAIDVVRVSSRDRRFVYYAGYTELVSRPRGTSASIVFGEATPGGAVPVREWYPSGLSTGHRFRYR